MPNDDQRGLLAWPFEEIVYGVSDHYGMAFFAPRSQAQRSADIFEALSDAKTWGDLRARLDADEAAEVESKLSHDDDEPPHRPPDEMVFEKRQVVDEEGDWPRWPPSAMAYWFPDDTATRFGEVFGVDPNLRIPPESIEAVAEDLRGHGFVCIRDDPLIGRIALW